jgi:acyl-coenzyme A thioesterase PaaI-like protein
MPEPDHDLARERLTAATRRIIEQLATATTDQASFAEAEALVHRAAELLAARGERRTYEGIAEGSLGSFMPNEFFDYSPLVGRFNALAPPIEMAFFEDRIEGTVIHNVAYEGPPGCVHGGFIAAGFDEVLGFAQQLAGAPGMTGRLEISYRSPTPLFEPVRYVGVLERVEGRRIHTRATLSVVADGRLCAEAEGLFISLKPERFGSMIAARGMPH